MNFPSSCKHIQTLVDKTEQSTRYVKDILLTPLVENTAGVLKKLSWLMILMDAA